MLKARILAAALTVTVAEVVSARTPPDLPVDQGKSYRHELSGLVIPATLGGLPRTSARAFAPDHLDEAFNFATPDVGEDITVFVFRNVSGSVPVWFDRVTSAIEHREVYGDTTIAAPATAFTPPGQRTASGLIEVWRPGKGRYRSTGMAFMPLGPQWYVELRYSSATVTPAAMDARLREVIGAIGWPGRIESQPAATPVTDCTTPLALTGRASAIAAGQQSSANILLGAMVASMAGKHSAKDPRQPPRAWCRDTGSYGLPAQHGVYRPIGTSDQYLLAFNDAGRGIWVAPNTLALTVNGEAAAKSGATGGAPALTWSIAVDDIAQTIGFADRDRLPPPDQAAAIVRSEPYASKTSTWGDKRNVTINSSALK